MTTGERLTVRLTPGVACIMELGCDECREAFDLAVLKETARYIEVESSREGLKKLASELDYRTSMGAWDQPLAWVRSAKINARRIRDALRGGNIEPKSVNGRYVGYSLRRNDAPAHRAAPWFAYNHDKFTVRLVGQFRTRSLALEAIEADALLERDRG